MEALAAWAEPAEPEEVEDVAAFLITAVEPGANDNRVKTLIRVVAMQGYTRAELLLGLRTLPVRNAYGQGFRPDLLDEIIRESRRVRAVVGDARDGKPRLLTERQMFDACQQYPEHFRPEDFGISGYDRGDRPMYRYARKSGPHRHEPNPRLLEEAPADRSGDEGGTFALAEFIRRPEAPQTGEAA